MNLLSQIIEAKRSRLQVAKRAISDAQIRERALSKRRASKSHLLIDALGRNDRLNVIAEFKRKSPSKGVIRGDVSAREMTRLYEIGGAAAVSVLTEEDFFGGSLDDLREVRDGVLLPVLRKDFIVDEYQVFETAASGADALLLIVAALDDTTLVRLRRITEDELGMDALVEVHDDVELKRAVNSGAKLIGVNNRDLKTFNVSLTTSESLIARAPAGVVFVSESGLDSIEDVRRLRIMGYKGFLIGEKLMRSNKPDEALRELSALEPLPT